MKIILESDQQVYFFTDPHYGHENLCRPISKWTDLRSTRDFASLEEMNKTIVDGINSRVRKKDVIVCLGDWAMGGHRNIPLFRSLINCDTVHLFLGNHDEHIESDNYGYRSLFTSIHNLEEVRIVYSNGQKYNFLCCHYPLASWNGMSKGVIHTHGHTHLTGDHKTGRGRHIDVSMDGNNFLPYTPQEIVSLVGDKPIHSLVLPYDHHSAV